MNSTLIRRKASETPPPTPKPDPDPDPDPPPEPDPEPEPEPPIIVGPDEQPFLFDTCWKGLPS